MSCNNPLQIKVGEDWVTIPCRNCMGCRIDNRNYWVQRTRFEAFCQYKKGKGNSFTTLTYTPANTPIDLKGRMTLRKDDLQKYFKRCRKWLHDKKINVKFKYVACGEMGGINGKPHYHIIFLGLDSAIVSEMTRHTWREGLTQTKTLVNQMIRYTYKYMEKQLPYKIRKEEQKKWGFEHPFILRSKGIGSQLYKNMAEKDQYIDGKIAYAPIYWRNKYGLSQQPFNTLKRQFQENLCKREKLVLWHYLKDCQQAREYKYYMKTILSGNPAQNINKGNRKVQVEVIAEKALKGGKQ